MTTPSYQLFIDGQWRDGEAGFPAINPFTQEPWATIPQASEADVHAAVAAARNAMETRWRATSGLERARLLHRLADLMERDADRMGRLETTDNGKVIRENDEAVAGSLPGRLLRGPQAPQAELAEAAE